MRLALGSIRQVLLPRRKALMRRRLTALERDRCHPNNNPYHQKLDPNTGKPILSQVLTWNDDPANWVAHLPVE